MRDAEQLLDFGLVRRAGRHPAEPEQRVARIDEHGSRSSGTCKALAGPADDRRRDEARAVVGHEQRVAARRSPDEPRLDRAPICGSELRARLPGRSARPAASPNGRRRPGCASWSAFDSRVAARSREGSRRARAPRAGVVRSRRRPRHQSLTASHRAPRRSSRRCRRRPARSRSSRSRGSGRAPRATRARSDRR